MKLGRILQQGIGDYVMNAITEFGLDVNTKRQLPLVNDGLKPVYRRAIYACLENGNSMQKVAGIAGNMIGTTHPHGDRSCAEPVSNLVRWGILTGQGNHGKKTIIGQDSRPSAARYTEAKISDKYYKIFSDLMPYVPYENAEIKGVEPEYLPTPIPLCLTFGLLGIGIGVNARMPVFTPKSLLKAVLANDPYLLEAPYGLDIIQDESELQELWDTGIGRVTYSYRVTRGSSSGTQGSYITGVPELFKPNLLKFTPYVNSGRVFINDESDKTGTRIYIGRNYNVKGITLDQIQEMAEGASKSAKVYRLTVTDGKRAFLIPMKKWLELTYANYLNLLETYRLDKIQKFEFDYKVFDSLPKVVETLYNNRDYDQQKISEVTKIELEVVSAILQKSISTLRNIDSTKKLASIKEKIDEFKFLDKNKKLMDIMNEF